MRLPDWVPPQARTVRVRLTALYAVLFLISGALLLAIASGVAVGRSSAAGPVPAGPGAGPAVPAQSGESTVRIHPLQSQLARLQSRVMQLENQLQNQLASQPGQDRLFHVLAMASLIALGVMTIVAAGLGWLIAGRALRPVRLMTAAARRISEDNLHERLAVGGPRDELTELGDTIDGLLARLEGAFTAQRRFVANASHELRTPLTTMRASIDVAVAKPEPAPPQTVALAARLRAELDKIDALLDAFLTLARAQHRNLPGGLVLPLDDLVGAALAGQADAIRARNLTVRDSAAPGGAWVTGSQPLLSRLVDNVIVNAVRHNADGGWIAIATHADGRRVSLVVENGGDRLDPRQVAGLAQPFTRLGADRTGSDKGSGLGLSIVAAIAESHGGTLDLRARDGGGLRVRVDLPAAARPAAATAGAPV